MPIYAFECPIHGEFELWQKMQEPHVKAKCPCGKMGGRIFYPIPAYGNLPNKDPRPGKTRAELFDNLAKEGFMKKEWRADDEPINRSWTDAGVKEKLVLGWRKSLDNQKGGKKCRSNSSVK